MKRTLFLYGRGAAALFAAMLVLPLDKREAAAEGDDLLSSPGTALPTVILISLDGTGPKWVNGKDLPTLSRLAREGLQAEKLIPVRPTNTFPNHVTLVTGVDPERHGIVNNRFVDPRRGVFSKKEIETWIEEEPVWSIAARQGVVSASYHWVGSEGRWPGGRGPRHWVPFDTRTSEFQKVDQILAWLALEDPCLRPRLVTSWFHGADHAAHVHGLDTDEVHEVLRPQDRALARLWEGVREQGLASATTLLVVSDHGMREAKNTVNLSAALREAGVAGRVLGVGGYANIYLADPGIEVVEAAIAVAEGQGLRATARMGAPDASRLDNPRFGDVVVEAPAGTAIVSASTKLVGFHGYPPEDDSMAGLFVAVGLGVPSGRVAGPIFAVDVAPTVLALLGLAVPASMEGKPLGELSYPPTEATNFGDFATMSGCESEEVERGRTEGSSP